MTGQRRQKGERFELQLKGGEQLSDSGLCHRLHVAVPRIRIPHVVPDDGAIRYKNAYYAPRNVPSHLPVEDRGENREDDHKVEPPVRELEVFRVPIDEVEARISLSSLRDSIWQYVYPEQALSWDALLMEQIEQSPATAPDIKDAVAR